MSIADIIYESVSEFNMTAFGNEPRPLERDMRVESLLDSEWNALYQRLLDHDNRVLKNSCVDSTIPRIAFDNPRCIRVLSRRVRNLKTLRSSDEFYPSGSVVWLMGDRFNQVYENLPVRRNVQAPDFEQALQNVISLKWKKDISWYMNQFFVERQSRYRSVIASSRAFGRKEANRLSGIDWVRLSD